MNFSRPVFFAILSVISLFSYSNSFNVPFILDDLHVIFLNAELRDLSNLKSVLTSDSPNRPFLYLTLALNFAANGLDPFGFHVVNFLFHIASSWLVFLILSDIFNRDGIGSPFPAAFAAMVFAVHPINVETVTYVSSRSTGMAVFFYLLSFRLVTASGFKLGIRFSIALFAFVLGCLTKEIAITLPALLTVFAFQFSDKENFKKSLPALAIFWLVVPIIFAYRAAMTGYVTESSTPEFTITPITYFYTQLVVVAFRYIPRLFVPVNLAFDADSDYRLSPADPQVIAGGFLLLFMLFAAYLYFRERKAVSFFILWFLVSLSVTSSFITIFDAYAERRLYIALPAFLGAVTYLAHMILEKYPGLIKAALPLALAVIVSFGSLTFARNRLFATPKLLWEDTIGKTTGKARIYAGLAGEYIKEENMERAEEILNFASKAFPDDIDVKLKHILMLGAKGDWKRMEAKLAEIKPVKKNHRSRYHNFMGIIEGEKGNYDAALDNFKKALRLNPENSEARVNMSVLFMRIGRKDEAVNMIRDAVKERPYNASYHFHLANLILDTNRVEAIREYRLALELNPFHIGAKKALGLP